MPSPACTGMAVPVPKPRARYPQNFRNSSIDSNVSLDGSEINSRKPEVNSQAEADSGLNGGNEDSTASVGGEVKFFRPPPLFTSASGEGETLALSEWTKESNSDSSSDESPPAPVSSQAEKHPVQLSDQQQNNVSPVPNAPVHNTIQTKPAKTKKPRAATIRVSRRKQSTGSAGSGTQPCDSHHRESAVARSSWLDVWKGRKHNVLWTTFDGQLMSLWKKRTDKFTEYVFHVSNITNVRQQDKGRFSIYFRKKHFEFMAHSEAMQEGWVTSLHTSRGREPPPQPQHHGPLTMKEPRTKVYAAICGHNLWIYNSKEDFNLGLGMTLVSMNVASVKETGRRHFSLITPYKTFNFSTDSSRDLNAWLNELNEVIRSALSCSEVALRLWASPWNKVCADCGSSNPEWASINLLVVICEACAGVHRSMGSSRSKVRSLKMDSKVWTEPLIELFVIYGNKAANNVWGHNVPAAEQILPDASQEERAEFIKAKYCRGLYRKAHPLISNQTLLNQRLCEVVRGVDVEETLSLLCSGAKVQVGPQSLSAISLAENAGQALQTELLRHNEYTEAPNVDQQKQTVEQIGLEELHGKLEDERFLFSLENESAAYDVLDLREVISIFNKSSGQTHEFEMLTLTDSLSCNADGQGSLLSHMLHIIRVVMPGPLADEELEGVMAVSRLSLREGSGLQHAEVWASLRPGEMLIYPTLPHTPRSVFPLNLHTHYSLHSTENTIQLTAAEKTLYLQFERDQSCSSWFNLLPKAASSQRKTLQRSVYTLPAGMRGRVPAELERCFSHITLYGLKVDGLYRRCGTATKISRLVEQLRLAPANAVLGTDELDVVDVAGALKLFLRQMQEIIPSSERSDWVKAAGHAHETQRLPQYRSLVKRLHPDNRATLAALCGHLYVVQLHSQVNRMTAHNLAVVFVPTLFQELAMNTDVVRLTKELIIHHTLVFLSKEEVQDEEEMITVF
ncbi:arf-GAP with Rho-GAP domain, ANK repeat and PH domain-containing protein 1 isoform X1 [Colossoma macropomum]|uniref:arf-GAP with Rho-GAP domain, ANK repeat and PH domain-containing protein 1 isoform X1 n=1 Tax=Colossoma macropomum TaxID=42526 RepID=UPI001864E44D|nr:arf-GAP with Rho-GAP domain, ANK repeat and PH domain-containing protein 1 isoform X1 [Colossoma macropomum]